MPRSGQAKPKAIQVAVFGEILVPCQEDRVSLESYRVDKLKEEGAFKAVVDEERYNVCGDSRK